MSGGGGGECFTCLSPGVRFYQVCPGTYSACGAGTGVPGKRQGGERERGVCQCCYVCGGFLVVLLLVIAVFGMEKRYRQ